MQGTKEKKRSDEIFQHYLKHFSIRHKKNSPGRKAPPDYFIETPFGKAIAAVLDYESPSEIGKKLTLAKKRWRPYQRMKSPFVVILHKGGLPGLEHRFIQEAIQNDRLSHISAVGLLEGRPGQERLRVFHNRFAKYSLDRRIFDQERDRNFFLADLFRKDFFWIAEEAL